ncbi:TPA: fimbrial protein [Enterobacter mori]
MIFVALNAFASDCQNEIEPYTKNINFGNVSVQRDVPVGTVIATQEVIGDVRFICNSHGAINTYHEVMYTPLSSYGNDVYDIGVDGVGIRISENSKDGTFHHYFPAQFDGWVKDGQDTLDTYLYKFELIKTNNVSKSGNIRTGTIADTSMVNQFYIGTFVITGGSVNTVACSLSTTSLTFNMGNIDGNQFSDHVGFVPEQNITQELNLSCDPDVNINVKLSAKQNNDIADSSVLALDGDGEMGVANGVGVQLLCDDIPLEIGKSIFLKTSSGGEEQFNLKSQYYQTKTVVTAGKANALATLDITYQ